MALLAVPTASFRASSMSSSAAPAMAEAASDFASDFASASSASAENTAPTATATPCRTQPSTAALVSRYHHTSADAWALLGGAGSGCRAISTLTAALASTHNVLRHVLLALSALSRLLAQAVWWVWSGRTATRLRRKMAYELAATVLGPSGNMLLLLVLWPGWVLLLMVLWAVRAAA